jgi:hypothetical protein
MRAVIHVPERAAHWATDLVLRHCEAAGHEVVSLAIDWAVAMREVVCTGNADVLVVASRAHLSPLRVPRLEVADELVMASGHLDWRRPRRR